MENSFTPSFLSIIAAGFYVMVAISCGRASAKAPQYRRSWIVLAAVFVLLAASRMLSVEDILRDGLREILRTDELYETRRAIQWPVAIVALSILAMVAGWQAKTFAATQSRRGRIVRLAILSTYGMAGLIALRMISLGPIDHFLNGPLKLNWILDMGFSLAVLLASIRFVTLPKSGERVRH